MKKDIKLPETEEGTVLFNIDPIIIKQHYEIDYVHSYAQDSPFFAGLTKKKLLGSRCTKCGYTYATPRGHCMECGTKTEWFELPLEGRVHTFTTCYFGSEAFLKETPFTLILVEFDGINTLFLSRLIGVKPDGVHPVRSLHTKDDKRITQSEKPRNLTSNGVKIGMKVRARFLRNCKFKPTDVYFVPVSSP